MSKRILIVDDDPNITGYLSDFLAEEGYKTLTANNGKEAERVRDHLYAMSAALAAQSGEPERFIIEPEMRALAAGIRAALESRAARAANPEQVAAVAHSLARADARLAELRGLGTTRRFDLPKLAQFFAFYQALRGLGEALGRE